MTPAEIPRLQSQRVALFVQQFGKFDSGKNAYWSLRKGRPVTLAEGARFDVDMRAGRLAPAGTLKMVRGFPTLPSRTGATGYRVATKYPRTFGRLRAGGRMGWWKNANTGQMKSGSEFSPPSRMAGWQWSLKQPYTGRISLRDFAPPQERLLHMPTEAKRIDALPASPPPGPARPPSEPLFEAIMRQLREKQAGPATSIVEARPAFATPGRTFTSAAPGVTVAGFDMKKLVLPLVLVAGAFVVSKLV